MGAYDKFYVTVSIFMMLGFYAAIPLGFLVDTDLYAIMAVWVIYLILSLCTGTCKYIQNVVRLPHVF